MHILCRAFRSVIRLVDSAGEGALSVKFTTLIPTRFNDGRPVDPVEIESILMELTDTFGRCTVEGTCVGHWNDPRTGKRFQDETLRVSIACENERYLEALAAVTEAGRRLRQRTMYFELRDFDGVRILPIK